MNNEINNVLDEFKLNIYNNNYNIDCDLALKQLANKNIPIIFRSIYKNNNKNITINRDGDIAFAISCDYKEKLLCKLLVFGNEINSFIINPNEIEWLLNGTPLILIALAYHDVKVEFYDLTTNNLVIVNNISIYNALLPFDTRRYIAQNSQICKLDTNKYFKTDLGQGSLLSNQENYNFDPKEKLSNNVSFEHRRYTPNKRRKIN
jgi:hypothetical protein